VGTVRGIIHHSEESIILLTLSPFPEVSTTTDEKVNAISTLVCDAIKQVAISQATFLLWASASKKKSMKKRVMDHVESNFHHPEKLLLND
jgi:hypothetical protein